MAAHTPRRIFAPSLVIIVGATLPACGEDQKQVVTPPPGDTAAPTATASASTTQNAPKTTPAEQWTITQEGTHCQAHVDLTCAPDESCNPPPPRPYPCPKQATSYPVALTKAAGSAECKLTYYEPSTSMGTCPKGAICNPPAPHQVTVTAPCPE
jgi:hypothetical protein